MEEQKKRVLRILMWLLPFAGLALLLVPALNPGRFFSVTNDWTYLDTLTRSMEIDQLFSKVAPGVRPLFALHAMMIFCCFVPLLGYLLQGIGTLTGVTAGSFKQLKIGDGLMMAGAGIQLLAAYGTIVSVVNATAKTAELCPQVTYQIPMGSIIIGALGLVQIFLLLINNRARTKADMTYMPMTRTDRRENIKGWLFISPFVIGFLVFTAYPLLSSAFASFTYYNMTAVQKWYAVRNFTNLFLSDDVFWLSLGNTMYYVLVSVPLVIILALLLALLMNTRGPLMGYFRTIYYLPNVLSGVAVFLLWQWMLDRKENVEALEFMMWFAQRYGQDTLNALDAANAGGSQDLFLSGKVAIFGQTCNYLATIAKYNTEAQVDYGCFPLPAGPSAPNGETGAWGGGFVCTVPYGAKNPAEATLLAEFLATEGAAVWGAEQLDVMCAVEANENPVMATYKGWDTVLDLMQYTKATRRHIYGNSAGNFVNEAVNKIMKTFESTDCQGQLTEAAEKIKKAIEDEAFIFGE